MRDHGKWMLGMFLAVACFMPNPAAAQRGSARCRDAYVARFKDTIDVAPDWCRSLAVYAIQTLKERAARSKPPSLDDEPRDLQSRTSGNAAAAGGAAQNEAVPTVQPTAIAGGTLGAMGSGGGADGIVAISLNPASFFPSGSVRGDAARSRVFDVTILAPVGRSDTTSRAAPDYLGVRVRLNFAGIRQRHVLDSAEVLFAKQADATARLAETLLVLLDSAPQADSCVTELLSESGPGDARLLAKCGQAFDVTPVSNVSAAFRRFTAHLRDSIDATYLGLDLRYDRGDPTFGEVAGLDGTFLFAGIAGGRRLVSRGDDQPSFGIRGRLGVQHITLDSGAVVTAVTTGTTVDAALAFEASYPSAFRPLRLMGGLEYRSGARIDSALDDALNRHGMQLRISLDVPLTAANGIAVSYATPLSGGGKPTLNVSFNWQLLLQELAPGVRGGR